MAPPFRNVIASETFVFTVGPSRKEFSVHANAFSSLSASLNTLFKNEAFVEARSKRISWDDVDIETFLRFCQFAYQGDYEEPSNSDEAAQEEASAESPGEKWEQADVEANAQDELETVDDFMWPQFAQRQEGRGRQWRCMQCRAIFYDSEMSNGCPHCPSQFYSRHHANVDPNYPYDFRQSSDESEGSPDIPLLSWPKNESATNGRMGALKSAVLSERACGDLPDDHVVKIVSGKPQTEPSQNDNLWTAISEHARLYVLAEKWGVEKLMLLTLRKLQVRLDQINVEEEESSMRELFALVRFAFENTATSKDMLRGLVTHFVAAEIMTADMGKKKGFLALLEDTPDFAKAIWLLVYRLRMI